MTTCTLSSNHLRVSYISKSTQFTSISKISQGPHPQGYLHLIHVYRKRKKIAVEIFLLYMRPPLHCENIVCKMHYTCYSHDIGLPNPKGLLSSTDRPSRKRTGRCKRRRSRNHRRKGTVDCVIFRLTYATQWVFVASATQLRLLLQSTRLHLLEAGSSAKFITHKNICVYDNCCCACMLHFN